MLRYSSEYWNMSGLTAPFWLAPLGLIIWRVVRLLPGSNGGITRPSGDAALEILDRRLASGQIDLEAWQSQRGALRAAQHERR
jgi:putative membrane protein